MKPTAARILAPGGRLDAGLCNGSERAKLRRGFGTRFGFRQPANLYRNAHANDAFLLLGKGGKGRGGIRADRMLEWAP